MKLLIIGHARHGKDTVAGMIQKLTGMSFKSSSIAAAEIFLFDALKEKYGYKTIQECFEDRVNHRKEWHDLIKDYNKEDRARLAKEILKDNDIYVGMRSSLELEKCLKDGIFDYVIGVTDYRKDLEPEESFDIQMHKYVDWMIPNFGTIEELQYEVVNMIDGLCIPQRV